MVQNIGELKVYSIIWHVIINGLMHTHLNYNHNNNYAHRNLRLFQGVSAIADYVSLLSFYTYKLCPYTSAQWLVLHNQTWRSHHVIIVPMELSAL